MEWLDVSPLAQVVPTPAAQQTLAVWAAADWAVRQRSVVGPTFWQTTEIEDAADLVPATVAALAQAPTAETTAVPAAVAEAA